MQQRLHGRLRLRLRLAVLLRVLRRVAWLLRLLRVAWLRLLRRVHTRLWVRRLHRWRLGRGVPRRSAPHRRRGPRRPPGWVHGRRLGSLQGLHGMQALVETLAWWWVGLLLVWWCVWTLTLAVLWLLYCGRWRGTLRHAVRVRLLWVWLHRRLRLLRS